ncbi:MAG: SDR family NAD(P)-dependent oxidoreductase [Pseudomonadales bacterium]
MTYDFSGQCVAITGGASGMGLAAAQAFARAGASVLIGDIADEAGETAAARIRGAGFDCLYQHTDVAIEADTQGLIDTARAHAGRLDVFVAAAGILGQRQMLHEQTVENVRNTLGVNVEGVVYGTKHAVNAFRQNENGRGVIVNFASVQSFRVKSPKASLYAASKAAVVSLTKSAALEYGAEGIRVNAIAPGPIDTPMLRTAAGNSWPPAIIGETPLGRLGEPMEVAEAVLWLASDAASYVSGATLPVDGGWLAP